MVATDIFAWTGIIVWSCILTAAVGVSIAATVVAPLWTFYRVKKVLWQWRFAAEIAEGKWTQDELWWAAATPEKPPCEIEEILKWMRRVEERAKHRNTLE